MSFSELYARLEEAERAIFDAEWEILRRSIIRERYIEDFWNWYSSWLEDVKTRVLDLIVTLRGKFNQPFRGFRADGNQIGWRWLHTQDVKASAIDTSGGSEPTHLYRTDYIGTSPDTPLELPAYFGFVIFGVEYKSGIIGFQYFDSKGYEHPPYFFPPNLLKLGEEFGWIPLPIVKEVTPEARLGLALLIEGEVNLGTPKPYGILVAVSNKYLQKFPPSW